MESVTSQISLQKFACRNYAFGLDINSWDRLDHCGHILETLLGKFMGIKMELLHLCLNVSISIAKSKQNQLITHISYFRLFTRSETLG